MLSRGVLASAPVRMSSAGASGTHLLASFIVFLVFCIVSFVVVSFVIMICAHGGNGDGGWQAQRVGDAWA